MNVDNVSNESIRNANSRVEIESTTDAMIESRRINDILSSSDSAILSASISETSVSDEEFEFPPLPLSLPPPTPVKIFDGNDNFNLPPLPVAFSPLNTSETSEVWDNESGFQNEDEDEFPPPPPPECFSPVLQTPSCAQENVGSDVGTNLILYSKEANNDTINSIDASSGNKLSSYFNILTSSTKSPYFKNNTEKSKNDKLNIEINPVEKTKEPDSSSIGVKCENQNSFAKLFKQLKLETSPNKIENNQADGNPNQLPLKFNNSDTMKSKTLDCKHAEDVISKELDIMDVIPPPLFANSDDSERTDNEFSTKKEQLLKNISLNNIIKEYYNDVSPPVQSKSNVPENQLKPTTPFIANALLPKHLKGGSVSEVASISNSQLRKESFDATIGELKAIMSGDVKDIFGNSEKWLGHGACDSKVSKSFSVDNSYISGKKESLNCSTLSRNDESSRDEKNIFDKNKLTPQKVKVPTAPKTFKVKKIPKVVGFTDEQINAVIESQNSLKSNQTLNASNDCSKLSALTDDILKTENYLETPRSFPTMQNKTPIGDQTECLNFKKYEEKKVENVIEDDHSTKLSNSEKSAEESKAEVLDNPKPANLVTDSRKTTGIHSGIVDKNHSEMPKSAQIFNNHVRGIMYGHDKGPTVKGFTEEQIKSLSSNMQQGNIKYDETDLDKNTDENDKDAGVSSSNATIDKNGKNRDEISYKAGVTKSGRKLQETKQIFEVANNKDIQGPSNKVGVIRSKSAVILPKKPVQIRYDVKAEEVRSNLSSNCSDGKYHVELQSNVEIKTLEDNIDNMKVNGQTENKDEITAVSDTRAFFEGFKQSQNVKNSENNFPKKAFSFSVNKTAVSPRLQDLRLKHQKQSKDEVSQTNPTEDKININSLKKVESFNETIISNGSKNDETIDDASLPSVESLVSKFGTLKKTPSNKILENCSPPESNTKLPGKSLNNSDAEPKKVIVNQNKQAWKSFLHTYSDNK